MLSEFIRSRDLPLNECGKLVVASTEAEAKTLDLLYERGSANGVPLELLSYPEALAIEPNLSNSTIAALWSPTTSTSDCKQVNKYRPQPYFYTLFPAAIEVIILLFS